ncbi:hypothetical protein EJC49_25390 [Aquibium carbonis]|uniref:Uncharacterized protein n=1 Tax=Aquibium carbonis TaxID=2495581 RepID=A0A429YB71_9HYPH|nr:hypothetical protein [Aquibium carbonis]RST78672.1 hypothetical protein EJC49_25390 [Aquibium carbonis]
MTNILSFTPPSAQPRGARPVPDGPAAIVIFPGVRYERFTSPERGAPTDKRAPGRKGKAKKA